MADGFDYLPYVRPLPDDWLFMAIQQFADLRAAGGYRFRMHVTRLETGPGMPNNISGQIIEKENPTFATDHGLVVRPGSLVYALLIYCQFRNSNNDWLLQNLTEPLELEIIHAQTNEPWWRSSQEAGQLANQPQTDKIWFSSNVAGGSRSERLQMGQCLWFLLGGREILGDGRLIVRTTDNRMPQSILPGPPFVQSQQNSFQVSILCAEPESDL